MSDDATPEVTTDSYGDTIVWEKPPPVMRNRWSSKANELRERPGEWGRVAENEDAEYALGSIRQSFHRKGCKVSVRVQPDGTVNVWAMWPGGKVIDDDEE